jgi:hypothetical protein
MSEENKIRDAADAVKGIVEAVPVYQDVVQPAAKEIGIALQTVAKTLHVVVSPAAAVHFGYEKLRDYLNTKLSEKLRHVPPERIKPPDLNVAVPALEGLTYSEDDDLRELFTNLLASSMDEKTAQDAHPSFAQVIKQMSPDEARILKFISDDQRYYENGHPLIWVYIHLEGSDERESYIPRFSTLAEDAGCKRPESFHAYLDNLQRLKLIEIRQATDTDGEDFKALRSHPNIVHRDIIFRNHGWGHADYKGEYITRTAFGSVFIKACVSPPEQKPNEDNTC